MVFSKKVLLHSLLAILWIFAVAFGFALLTAHANAPGFEAQPPAQWPAESKIVFPSGKPTLLVFLHPGCSCSNATLGELDRLLPAVEGSLAIFIVIVPLDRANQRPSEREIAIRERFEHFQITFIDDRDLHESNLFNAQTSGQVVLYDKAKKLAFRGGITPSRGHMGDSTGREAILRFMETQNETRPTIFHSKVFGCGLTDPHPKTAETL